MYDYELTLTNQATGESSHHRDHDFAALWDQVNRTPPGFAYVLVRLDPDRSTVDFGSTY